MKYDQQLEELISLLLQSSENHWAKYFTEALYFYNSGEKNKSYKKVLGAYGGMGSFNDIGLNFITNEEVERVLEIKKWLYSYSKKHKKNIFGF
ncbi:MAG: hypothetical protein RIC57_08740 [Balneola sp.]